MRDRNESSDYSAAIFDFQRARSQAQMRELLARLTGSTRRLLAYEDVRHQLRLQGGILRGVRDIPLNAIVGSVGRYSDFTRDFLPLRESTADRWARVKVAASGLVGLPPIDVYQIGNVYFVKDGNHRVSVARQLGGTHIQAYVTEVQTRVPLNPDVQPDDLIRIAEYTLFLEQTRLDLLRPDADLSVSIPGQYPLLLNHIEVHRYYMGLELQRDVSYEEAVGHWYDTVYLPLIEVIHNQGILHRFPGRTDADLYLWVTEHRAQLEAELGTPVRPEYAASHVADEHSQEYQNLLTRLGSRLLHILTPDKLEAGPPAGRWRSQISAAQLEQSLFVDLLVPLNGQEDGWCALEQAFVVAQRETANIYGLHVTRGADESDPAVQAVRAEFEERCRRAGLNGRLVVTAGEVFDQTCQRATVTDLVVVNLSHPPAAQPLARLGSGMRDLIQRCPRPVLATPQTVSQLNRPLLAFDGSPKAREALFIATYLAGKWNLPLTVVTVNESQAAGEAIQAYAREYLAEHNVQAEFHVPGGQETAAILQMAEEHENDWIIMGGYGLSPVLELALSSVVNNLLRESTQPILICR